MEFENPNLCRLNHKSNASPQLDKLDACQGPGCMENSGACRRKAAAMDGRVIRVTDRTECSRLHPFHNEKPSTPGGVSKSNTLLKPWLTTNRVYFWRVRKCEMRTTLTALAVHNGRADPKSLFFVVFDF